MKTRDIIMSIVIGLIFVAAIVGVIVGVVTHDEPGFIPGVPEWSRDAFPLRVHASTYTSEGLEPAEPGDQSVVEDAMGFFDDGFFVWTEDASRADVVIVIGVPSESGWMDPGGDSRLVHRGGLAERCEIATSNTGTSELLWMTLAHEMGHCLGLAHDSFDLSIMRPVQRPTMNREFPPKVTDHDRALLRERYGL